MKTIITTFGLPGTGKTSTAKWLSSICEVSAVISRNHVRQRLNLSRKSIGDYAYKDAEKIDKIFFRHAKWRLLNRDTVILDATFRTRHSREQLIALAMALNCQVVMVECVCSYQNIVHNLRQEEKLKTKSFVEPIRHVLDFYIDTMQHFSHDELKCINYVRFDSERKRIAALRFHKHFKSPTPVLS